MPGDAVVWGCRLDKQTYQVAVQRNERSGCIITLRRACSRSPEGIFRSVQGTGLRGKDLEVTALGQIGRVLKENIWHCPELQMSSRCADSTALSGHDQGVVTLARGSIGVSPQAGDIAALSRGEEQGLAGHDYRTLGGSLRCSAGPNHIMIRYAEIGMVNKLMR